MTKEESRDPLFKGMVTVHSDGDTALVMGKTACHFLDRKTGHCRIYARRPMACRGFVCHSHPKNYVIDVIHGYPALRKHLKRQGLLPEPPPEDSFFYTEPLQVGDTSEWHLRDLRGRKDVDVGRYSARRGSYEMIGWFDSQGLFHRRQI